ncbi:penicillin acylase family protein [Maribacter cobaltidurans]|uniref:Penicillin acylase family protein n=1 Tax=Maribacter cobaltidurans TaxID=1178778 RepID=A0A223V0U1_9FLAO|nr:penicillin acylase family protein [Maribacter cobaltidurans]ASV28916.1 penicillin acylase family protein [Maribacter cobaltidurans]GGD73724.1 penicillin amidase [Maribacter cobaltidurans]
MKKIILLGVLAMMFSCKKTKTSADGIQIAGLQEPVEIVRDQWGVNHIYANNQHDLFFAQGYAAAADRLFQFEIWRRQATGTVAEILGERELKRDIGTRLFKFRGDMETEMNHYHEDGVEIITAYTDGVNAYIEEQLKTPEKLPIEFKILDILPQKWTPEVVISRHQGLLGNINDELQIGRAVALLGPEKAKELFWLHPKDPDLTLDKKINQDLLSQDILELYNAYRKSVKFTPSDVLPKYRDEDLTMSLFETQKENRDSLSIGSNNWVVNGSRTKNGHTYMANDPHRTIAVPSLRYMAHLVAPGWNVIGGGEPEIPGISIGHNEYGTWGLTVFETDGEDLYVYELNPENSNQYKYQGQWEDMKNIQETIKIKGQKDTIVNLSYTRHGPVTHVDMENNVAYAVRCAWLEPGGSPYLASLRMDQAKNWEEFREACSYSHIPGENMVWADKNGDIGWQAVGIAPIRRNFNGLVPVPGDGSYEWDGYLPIIEKPNDFNPEKGFIATANQNVTPPDYQHWDAIGYTWADPYRGNRIDEVLKNKSDFTMEDFKKLQTDYLSLPAMELVPYLNAIQLDEKYGQAKMKLQDWDFKLNPNSIAAAIYVAWEDALSELIEDRFIPAEAKEIIPYLQLKKILEMVGNPDTTFGGADAKRQQEEFLKKSFMMAIDNLEKRLGPDMEKWQYGQPKNKHVYIEHALGAVVNKPMRDTLFNLGPLPRGGNSYTPGSTGGNLNQSSGASFRLIVNTGDWDSAQATNGPGQSGNPESPFYKNLFEPWAKDQYFPVYYSRQKIDSVAVNKTNLLPLKK